MTSAPDKGGDPSLDFTTPATIPTVRRHQMDVPLLLLRAALLQNWPEEGWEVRRIVAQRVRLKRTPTYGLASLHDFVIMSVPRHHVQKLCLAWHTVITNTLTRPWKVKMFKIFGLEAPVESCQGVILPWTKRRNAWNTPGKVWRQAFQDSLLGCDVQFSSLVWPSIERLKLSGGRGSPSF